MEHKDLLLEIGTEEIPAIYITPALEQLQELMQKGLVEARIKHGAIRTYATPRRLAVYCSDVATHQQARVQILKGPSKEAAFDEEGQPTRAAQGFARSKGVDVGDLNIEEVNGREYVFVKQKDSGLPAVQVLQDLLPNVITSLTFPKTMRWGQGDFRFVRPIHWLVALLGQESIPFCLAGIDSGRQTRGHRFWGAAVELKEPQEYLKALQDEYVIADHRERRQLILDTIESLAKKHGGKAVYDEEHLEEVTFLVEYPEPILGSFDRAYLELPPEVLITSMKRHQRYFPLAQGDTLLPLFIAFKTGPGGDEDRIRQGNEKVLKGRLEDALFFFKEDVTKTLSQHGKKLDALTYLKELGSMKAKQLRLEKLIARVVKYLHWNEENTGILQEAASLCKADLVTQMVQEFPELQGVMGKRYALHEGKPPAMALALEEQYLPRFAEDHLPESGPGKILALMDRMDNLAAAFYAGYKPSGSQDPLALRRQGLAVMKILHDLEETLTIDELFQDLAHVYAEQGLDLQGVQKELLDFLAGRLGRYMEELGFRYDSIDAILHGSISNVKAGIKRARALESIRGDEAFLNLVQAYIRIANILARADSGDEAMQETLLVERGEMELYRAIRDLQQEADVLEEQGKYLELFQHLSQLSQPLEDFFNEVMVMVEDHSLQKNRLALLQEARNLLDRGVDLSRIVLDT